MPQEEEEDDVVGIEIVVDEPTVGPELCVIAEANRMDISYHPPGHCWSNCPRSE